MTTLQQQVQDLTEVLEDKRRLTRVLDVALSGEEGAAKQASLCDLIPIARELRNENLEMKKLLATLMIWLDNDVPCGFKGDVRKYASKEIEQHNNFLKGR